MLASSVPLTLAFYAASLTAGGLVLTLFTANWSTVS